MSVHCAASPSHTQHSLSADVGEGIRIEESTLHQCSHTLYVSCAGHALLHAFNRKLFNIQCKLLAV